MSKLVTFKQTGESEVLEISDVMVSAPEPDEVQIRVHAIGLNRAEIMYRRGEYVIEPTFPSRLGYEAAGIVEATGINVSEFQVGDSVSVIPSFMFTEYGTYGEMINMPARAVVRHPDNLSLEEAAASWMMYVTAYGALIEYGNLKADQNVAIRAASSSVGLAAIQIANMVGARPIALTRTSEKKDILKSAGAADVVATAEQDIVAELHRASGGEGIHIVFDPVGGPEAASLFRSMASGGAYFQYGALDPRDINAPVMDVLSKHLTLRGYELFEITMDDEKLARAKAFVSEGLRSGQLKPLIDKRFTLDDIAAAHDYMELNGQTGKIIVTL
ncbi:TPA: zinc-dependent alcohol dehydrogenase family protein [Yersinia enterocolitica]|uniref:Zinc-dependent alcohol dehydrogenase family protein n=1 Tax=Yersinia enterocolitica TaxID=630 RepID=A0AAD2UW55_YEREN|nr:MULTISPECIES: zinc-dependent alcohol dehydrogenase family protein [Yersiniaceae]EKN6064649.1 alcohol dehydrogenase [Yersinia enterocolitica]ELI8100347.1 zinc-dependent alcohol dehydrogenase family protein [Yersinia enterocolitica]PKE28155.1 alcohol dehydrogenase [Rahnella sp. AA]CQQ28035.1 Zinc-binding dehydrogenase [Yersinia enterocolitica]CRX42335.1 Zinc-binding dehydrogenase [Yersinia enterocolitica]